MPCRLGILTTHPIQYQVPWFRALAARPEVDLTVFYCMIPDDRLQGDGFGRAFQWDIPLLQGYRYEVLENVSKSPSVARFSGCDTPGIRKIVAKRPFDAFIVNGWVVKSCLQLLAACWRHGVPCIVRGESNALRPRARWKRLVHRVLLGRYAAFLSIGKSNREFYILNGVPAGKIFSTPYGVENERFAALAAGLRPKRDAIRAEWGIPPDAQVFLFCGKFVEKKRPMDVLRALESALDGPRPVCALMVGDGELRPECEEFAREKRLPAAFTGFLNQSEIPRAYVASDVIVLASDYGETWGLVVNEAMACGVPALVSDRAGCGPDLIVPSETGLTYPFGDCAALGEAMRWFAAHAEEAVRMGQRAREHVAAYSVERVVSGVLDAIEYVGRDRR